MKIPLAVAVFFLAASAAKAALPCALADADFKALELSPSKLARDGVEELNPDQQRSLCVTRELVRKLKRRGSFEPSDRLYSSRYLAPLEKTLVNRAINAAIQNSLPLKGRRSAARR